MIDRLGNWYPDWPGQQPYQDPAYVRMYGQNQQQQTQQTGQMMTPPTIDAKIIQVDSIEAIDRFPMAAGTSQMYMTKDEQTIVVRSMYANGQHSDDVWDKRPPAPPAPTLNPAEYVRKDELQALIAEALQARTAPTKAKKEEAA
jgi:hypothetical protein